MKWEYIKMQIRKFSIELGLRRSSITKIQIADINLQIDFLRQSNVNNVNDLQIEALQTQLDTLNEIRAKTLIMRSKTKYAEEGEKCTKYFLNIINRARRVLEIGFFCRLTLCNLSSLNFAILTYLTCSSLRFV